MDGSLPPGLTCLSALETLDVNGNALKGSLVQMPSTLTFLDVESNRMTGAPFESLKDLRNLEQVHLSSNGFTGNIPTEVGQWSALEELWIANNRFQGATIPSEIGNLENLETLFLYNARIGGSIPSEIGNLDLAEFLANNNELSSEIPEEFWDNDGLTLLRLDSNSFSGSISTKIGNLVGLTDLFLSNNTFSSNLPATLLRLTSLGTSLIFVFIWSAMPCCH